MLWVLNRDCSFDHPEHMLKQLLMGQKIFTILGSKILFISKLDVL